jgi:trans-2-enoyl-CoA reductase
VPGSEAVFEVLATGSAVTTARPGDWVLAAQPGLGTWRTHLQADEDAVHRIERDGLTRAQAATVAVNPVTAYRLLVDFAPVVERGWVVLNGANSGVGRAALQLCRRWGVRAIAIVRDRPSRADSAALAADLAALGATHVVSEAELLAGGLGGRVRAWTAGDEVRLGLDCVGGRAAGAMARLLSPGGQMVTYGAMGRRPLEVAAGLAIFRGLEFRGFWVSRWAAANAAEKRRTVEELLEMMRRGELVDGPVAEVPWGPGAGREELVGAVQSTLDGFRSGKGLFVFGDT